MNLLWIFYFIRSITSSDPNDISGLNYNYGPERKTVYQPGTPGGQWTQEEIDSTRSRIVQMINPVWQVKKEIGTADNNMGKFKDGSGDVTENVLLRLAFHDCIPYEDGTGGCDGCLNFKNVGTPTPSPHNHDDYYQFDPINTTDNKGLDRLVEKLELIYTTLDWPFEIPMLEVSLFQSGNARVEYFMNNYFTR